MNLKTSFDYQMTNKQINGKPNYKTKRPRETQFLGTETRKSKLSSSTLLHRRRKIYGYICVQRPKMV